MSVALTHILDQRCVNLHWPLLLGTILWTAWLALKSNPLI